MFFISLCIYHGKLTKSVEHIFVTVKTIICSAKKETISIHIFVTVIRAGNPCNEHCNEHCILYFSFTVHHAWQPHLYEFVVAQVKRKTKKELGYCMHI